MKLLKWKQITWIIVNMAVLVFLSVYLITAFEMMIEYHWMCYGASLIVIFAFAGWKAIENITNTLTTERDD